MSVWICDQCQFSRTGPSYRRAGTKEFDWQQMPNVEICCESCWAAFLAVDPQWDWETDGWQAS